MTIVTGILSVIALLVFIAILIACGLLIISLIRGARTFDFGALMPRQRRSRGPNISVISLNREFENMNEQITMLLEDEESGAVPDHISKKNEELPLAAEVVTRDEDGTDDGDEDDEERPRMFAIDYKGDIMGTSNDDLIALVTTILGVAREGDEVVVSIESGGGTVPAYGLASSQIQRLKDKGLKVTACIDKVAASGGYMMACTADHVVCAPFGVVGSIGVVSAFPNYNNLLGKIGVDYKEYTAGEFKRTVSPMTAVTPEKEEKFVEQLEETHSLFKRHVQGHRSDLDIDAVATGEHWYGQQAIDLGLVDELGTSDDWVIQRLDDYEVYVIRFTRPLTLREKLSETISDAGVKMITRIMTESNNAAIQ